MTRIRHKAPDSEADTEKHVRFPRKIKFRSRVFATIYGRSKAYPAYRVSWSIHGKRQMKAFDRFGGKDGALEFAERTAKELATGSQVPALSSTQAADALAALELLDAFRKKTGQTVSLRNMAEDWTEAKSKLNGTTLNDAVNAYLGTVASVKRKDLAEAVDEFLESRRDKTEAKDGKRAQLSASYERHVASWLRGFAGAFPGSAVADLAKGHLNLYFKPLKTKVGAKNRNDRRAVITPPYSRRHPLGTSV